MTTRHGGYEGRKETPMIRLIPLMSASSHQLDMAAERYYDRLLNRWQNDGPETSCANCRYWDKKTGLCDIKLDDPDIPDDQIETAAKTDPDDCCDEHD